MANGTHLVREALGARLRELRRKTGLSGKDFAALLGCHPAKVTRIELGQRKPSEADLEAWADIAGDPELAKELVAQLHAMDTFYTEWRRQAAHGYQVRQRAISEIEANAAVIRVFECNVVPGLLQTADYARCVFTEVAGLSQVGGDIEAAVLARLHRQGILRRPRGTRFHFLMTEAALRYGTVPPEVMIGQLGQLIATTTQQQIRFGIIPFGIRLPVTPEHGFHLFDEQLVLVDTITAELRVTQPHEIAVHRTIFDRLATVARYGNEARALITAVLTDLHASPGQ